MVVKDETSWTLKLQQKEQDEIQHALDSKSQTWQAITTI